MSETQLILPKIRTSMQMSKASIDALKGEQHQKDTFQHFYEGPLVRQDLKITRKKILKIQHFELIAEEEEKTEEQKQSGGKSVAVGHNGAYLQTRSQYQTPTSDSIHKKPTFSETVFLGAEPRRYDGRSRRMSALVPNLPHIFKEDQFTKAVQVPMVGTKAELAPAVDNISSDELDDSKESIVAVKDLRIAAFRRSSTNTFVSVSPRTVVSPLVIRRVLSPQLHVPSRYLQETAKVLGRTHDIRKRHPIQRIPKRLFKDIV